MACTIRAAIRAFTDGAAAQAADATLNSASPPRNARLRPVRSAQRPAGTSSAANAIAYAFSTQESSLRLAWWKSRWMSGNAMLTMNRSSEAMNTPTETVSVTLLRRDMSSSDRH